MTASPGAGHGHEVATENLPLVDPAVVAARERARRRFIDALVDVLTADGRYVAAWLGGSIARGDDDALSDVDLCIVVSDEAAATLCAPAAAGRVYYGRARRPVRPLRPAGPHPRKPA